jgi:CPA1 family monovalent cation:H+ antiporter
MGTDFPVEYLVGIIGLLIVAAFSSAFFKKIGFPFTIGLVAVGVFLGLVVHYFKPLEIIGNFTITPNLLLYVLLPALLFDTAINMEMDLLKRNLVPVLALAGPGLILSTFVTGILITWATPLSFIYALAFGALISSTDPVAVISLFKEVGAPKRLVMLVDGESLFNDATAIVAFQVIIGLIAGGAIGSAAFVKAGFDFLFVFAGGFIVGAALGWLIVRTLSIARGDPFLEMTFTTIAAYLSFVLAQFYMHLSGVMAVIGTGMVIAYYSVSRYSAEGRQYMKMFWAFASFVTNSFIFLLLGITEFHQVIGTGRHFHALSNAVIAISAVLAARAVTVFGIIPLLNRLPRAGKIDLKSSTVIFWGGLRGALPVGLAISLTPGIFGPNGESIRATIIEMTFGVVLFTLLVQGTTIKRLIKLLGLDKPSRIERSARAYGISVAKKNATAALEKLKDEWCLIDDDFLKPRLAVLTGQENRAKEELADALDDPKKEAGLRNMVLWIQAVSLSRKLSARLYEEGFISERTMRDFHANCDRAEDDIVRFTIPPPEFDSMPRPTFLSKAVFRCARDFALCRYVKKRIVVLQLEKKFEWFSLTSEISAMVDSDLARIARLCGAGREEVGVCRRYFESVFESSRKELLNLKRQYPEAIEELAGKTVDMIISVSQQDSIKQLSETGGLSEDTAEFLKQGFASNRE